MEESIKNYIQEIDRPNKGRLIVIFSFIVFVLFAPRLFKINLPGVVLLEMLFWFLESYLVFDITKYQKTILRVKFLTYFQFIFDLFALTILLYFIGPIGWIAPIFYIFTITYSGFYASRKWRWIITILAGILYGGLVTVEYFNILPYKGIFPEENLLHYDSYAFSTVLTVFLFFF